ncbi:MAG: hypothetical protein RL329_2713 [Bacteroidota bacterium]|jgi:hypothetical protein
MILRIARMFLVEERKGTLQTSLQSLKSAASYFKNTCPS